MIEWKEFRNLKNFTDNIPSDIEFLIRSGTEVNIAKYGPDKLIGRQWWIRDGSLKLGVTHYAEINLPLKERNKWNSNNYNPRLTRKLTE